MNVRRTEGNRILIGGRKGIVITGGHTSKVDIGHKTRTTLRYGKPLPEINECWGVATVFVSVFLAPKTVTITWARNRQGVGSHAD